MDKTLKWLELENGALRFMIRFLCDENDSLRTEKKRYRDLFLKEASKSVIRVNGRFVKKVGP